MSRKHTVPFAGAMGGGKGGGSRAAKEAPDSIRSKSYARVIDLIGEGEIEGFVDRKGRKLRNAVLSSQPTINNSSWGFGSRGRVNNDAVLLDGGSGYSVSATSGIVYDGTIDVDVTDPTGSGSGAKARLTIVDGTVTAVTITNSGHDYKETFVEIPPAIGRSIYVDGEQLVEDDMTLNHKVTYLDFRTGTIDQAPFSNFGAAEETVEVSEPVKNVSPKSRTFSSPTADGVIVSVTLDSLFRQNPKNGDILPTSVEWEAWITYYGTDYTSSPIRVIQDTISGKTSSGYMRSKFVDLKPIRRAQDDSPTYSLEIRRVTPDNNMTYSDKLNFGSYTLVTTSKLAYPNSAAIAMSVDAENFSRIPTRAYRLRLLKVKVPSNYFPATRKYNRAANGILLPGIVPDGTLLVNESDYALETDEGQLLATSGPLTFGPEDYAVLPGGAVVDEFGNPIDQPWDGEFYTVWTNNPAWIFYDLATSERYGCGEFLKNTFGDIDKWSLYKIGRYCDQLVKSGYGSALEPRFTCNIYLQSREDAFKVLSDLASAFRGMLYWAAGTIIPVQDGFSDAGPVMTFTNSSVKDGTFTYSGVAKVSRFTVALIRWNDPNDFYRAKVEYVESPIGILKYGHNEKEVASYGCTSRGQARRHGLYLIETSLNDTETVVFRTGFEAAYLRPFDVIELIDNNRTGMSCAGRITAISGTRLVVTTDVRTLLGSSSRGYKAVFQLPAPYASPGTVTSEEDLQVMQRSMLLEVPVSSYTLTDGYLELTLAQSLPIAVVPGSVWGVISEESPSQTFRVVSIEEIEPNEFEVSAVVYHASKFEAIDNGVTFDEEPKDPRLSLVPSAPTNITFVRSRSQAVDGTMTEKLLVSWSPPTGPLVKAFAVYSQSSLSASSEYAGVTDTYSMEFVLTQSGLYSFEIYSIGLQGDYSRKALTGSYSFNQSVEVVGVNDNRVERITGLELVGQGNITAFTSADPQFEWRRNSALNSYEIGSEPNGANSGSMSDNFSNYIIRLYDPSVSDNPETPGIENLIYEGTTSDNRFTLSQSMHVQLAQKRTGSLKGIPWRTFVFEVTYRSNDNSLSEPQRLLVSNPRPAKLPITSAVGVTKIGLSLFITFPQSVNPDFKGYRVWISSVNNFVPAAEENLTLNPPEEAPAYEGPANPVIITLPSEGTYYLRYAEFDIFSTQALDCEISDQRTVT